MLVLVWEGDGGRWGEREGGRRTLRKVMRGAVRSYGVVVGSDLAEVSCNLVGI
jgi:hypothetical protein